MPWGGCRKSKPQMHTDMAVVFQGLRVSGAFDLMGADAPQGGCGWVQRCPCRPPWVRLFAGEAFAEEAEEAVDGRQRFMVRQGAHPIDKLRHGC